MKLSNPHFTDLEEQLKQLKKRRNVLEKRTELREANIAEFQALKQESVKRLGHVLERQTAAAKKRNDDIFKGLNYTIAKLQTIRGGGIDTSTGRKKVDSNELLQRAWSHYRKRVDEMIPTWQMLEISRDQERVRELAQEKRDTAARRMRAQRLQVQQNQAKDEVERQRRELVLSLALEQNDLMHAHTVDVVRQDAAAAVDNAVLQRLELRSQELRDVIETKRDFGGRYVDKEVEACFSNVAAKLADALSEEGRDPHHFFPASLSSAIPREAIPTLSSRDVITRDAPSAPVATTSPRVRTGSGVDLHIPVTSMTLEHPSAAVRSYSIASNSPSSDVSLPHPLPLPVDVMSTTMRASLQGLVPPVQETATAPAQSKTPSPTFPAAVEQPAMKVIIGSPSTPRRLSTHSIKSPVASLTGEPPASSEGRARFDSARTDSPVIVSQKPSLELLSTDKQQPNKSTSSGSDLDTLGLASCCKALIDIFAETSRRVKAGLLSDSSVIDGYIAHSGKNADAIDAASLLQFLRENYSTSESVQGSQEKVEAFVSFDSRELISVSIALMRSKSQFLLPIAAFHGMVTLDRLKREQKHEGGTAGHDLWLCIIENMRALVRENTMLLIDLASALTVVLTNHIPEDDRPRVSRKALNLLQLALSARGINSGETAVSEDGISHTRKPQETVSQDRTNNGVDAPLSSRKDSAITIADMVRLHSVDDIDDADYPSTSQSRSVSGASAATYAAASSSSLPTKLAHRTNMSNLRPGVGVEYGYKAEPETLGNVKPQSAEEDAFSSAPNSRPSMSRSTQSPRFVGAGMAGERTQQATNSISQETGRGSTTAAPAKRKVALSYGKLGLGATLSSTATSKAAELEDDEFEDEDHSLYALPRSMKDLAAGNVKAKHEQHHDDEFY